MEKILISACLVGEHTRYDGGTNEVPYWQRLTAFFELVPFCPEMEGGLPCPRNPANVAGNLVKTVDGKDVTKAYQLGAEKAYSLCRMLGIKRAILKEKSPACGVHKIHNYRRPEELIDGQGITAQYLSLQRIKVINEEEGAKLLQRLEERQRVKQAKAKAAEEKKAAEEEPKPKFERKDRPGKPYGKKGGKPFEKKDGKPYEKKPFKKKPYDGGKDKKGFNKGKPYHKDGQRPYPKKKPEAK